MENSRELGLFVCPKCREPLQILGAGHLCSRCKETYPVLNGIPRFVPSSNYASSFGFQWNIYAKTQLDSHSGLDVSRRRFFSVTQFPERLEGELVLEAGSGAGRFTEVLLTTGATVYSFDYSNAVEANFRNNGGHERLHLFQADIFCIPLVEASFDRVVCLGVLQHTPDPAGAFRALLRFVRPGGQIVVDVYKRHWQSTFKTKYWLRPLTRRLRPETLLRLVERFTPSLLAIQDAIRPWFGAKLASTLIPVSPADSPGLTPQQRIEWSILDTFDMYAPAHDHPQTLETVRRWCQDAGLIDLHVGYGPNGINARGTRPPRVNSSGWVDSSRQAANMK